MRKLPFTQGRSQDFMRGSIALYMIFFANPGGNFGFYMDIEIKQILQYCLTTIERAQKLKDSSSGPGEQAHLLQARL